MKTTLIPILTTVLLISCTSTRTNRIVTSGIGGAAGAALASEISDGNPAWTAAGAVGGIAAGEILNHAAEKKTVKAFGDGYDQGRSDAAKQQYWIMVENQRSKTGGDGGSYSLYDIPLPQEEIDGTLLLPRKRTLRIYE